MTDLAKRISVKQLEGLTLSLLKACGIPNSKDIICVTYRHHVGELPSVDVEYYAKPDWETVTLDGMELRSTTIQFVPLTT